MGYEKGDSVIVYASKRKHDKVSTDFSICKVVAVGKYDLICKLESKFFNRLFTVSRERCTKISKAAISIDSHTVRKPQVGDLVMSLSENYEKKRTELTGIVEEIIYDPVRQVLPYYIIRTGQKTETVYFENIIILESES